MGRWTEAGILIDLMLSYRALSQPAGMMARFASGITRATFEPQVLQNVGAKRLAPGRAQVSTFSAPEIQRNRSAATNTWVE